MTLEIYNTLSRKKEPFTPITDGKVKLYVCGMTVYSDAHIGHARTYHAFDVICRYLEYIGYDVLYVQNITDVDDKIIAAAQHKGIDALEYSCTCTDLCLTDLDRLGIKRATLYVKASETIEDMIAMIQQIIHKGYGYVTDGDVYFSVEKFPQYGRLSGQNIEELLSGVRIDPGEKKHNPLDFALWKQAKPGEPSWDSPWGKGRPGWHIECSAMSSKYLGLPFDIHGGGMDLRFPHHENEIAQAEAATGKPFVQVWMHIGLLTINGEKMSKSLGNIINVKDLLKRWDAEVIRFFFVQTHYRRPPDYSETALENAKKGLERIHRFVDRLTSFTAQHLCEEDHHAIPRDDENLTGIINTFKERFIAAMDDDFNTPGAVATLFEFVSDTNRFLEEHPNVSPSIVQTALDTLTALGQILTLFQEEDKKENTEHIVTALQELLNTYRPDMTVCNDLTTLLDTLLAIREEARKTKQWVVADTIRKELCCLGFEIQDTADGAKWRKL
jgi:cysteinyl-tRNA synthetase